MPAKPHFEPLAEWTPRQDEPVFAGHFPDNPLLPGALLIDWAMTTFNQHVGRPAAHGTIRQAKFPSPARPDVPLRLAYEPAPRDRTRLTITSHAPDAEADTVLELLVDAPPSADTGSA